MLPPKAPWIPSPWEYPKRWRQKASGSTVCALPSFIPTSMPAAENPAGWTESKLQSRCSGADNPKKWPMLFYGYSLTKLLTLQAHSLTLPEDGNDEQALK